MSINFKTAESVCMGHPDKLCDLIADSVLDECLRMDKSSRVACEVMATKGKIIVAGEITCSGKPDIRSIVKSVLDQVGYESWPFKIYVFIHTQSADIATGVNNALEARTGLSDMYSSIGAGDQGTVYGYATDETRSMLPLPLLLSHRIVRQIDDCRKDKIIEGIYPDGKAQVTIEYDGDNPMRVKTIVISVQHDKNKTTEDLREDIFKRVLSRCFEELPYDDDTEILVNPSGRFVEGGPSADTGLTGRKIMVDTYGGLSLQGGGALCGKDPTKVDRSGAYMARYIAKNIVAAGLAKRCEVAISYAIGKANPVAVYVKTFGTGVYGDDEVTEIVRKTFDMRPAAIIEKLRLKQTIYAKTATYGHFASTLNTWESTDMTEELRKAAARYGN